MDNLVHSRVVLEVDLDYFYAQCEEVRAPELVKKPVVVCVYSGRTENSGVVSTANYEARKLGVKSGIPIERAKKLLEREAGAAFLPMDSELYEGVSERIMEIIKSKAVIFEKDSIDEAFVEITSECQLNYGKAKEIGQQLKQEIKNVTGLTCSVGIGPNKLLAKMAADSRKPDGLTVIRPEEVADFLEGLPLQRLVGIGPKFSAKLNSLGIPTVGELARFDELTLSDVFGKKLGPLFKRLARGIDEEPVKESPAEQFSRITTLKQDATTFSFPEVLMPLAKDISIRLKSAGRKCKTVGIIYISNEIKLKNKSQTMDHLLDSEQEIFQIANYLFTQLFSSAETQTLKIRRVGLRVSGLSAEAPTPSIASSLEDYLEK